MPKQKTYRILTERFKRTGNGSLKRYHTSTDHRFHGKTKKQRRHLRKTVMASRSGLERIKQMLSQVR